MVFTGSFPIIAGMTFLFLFILYGYFLLGKKFYHTEMSFCFIMVLLFLPLPAMLTASRTMQPITMLTTENMLQELGEFSTPLTFLINTALLLLLFFQGILLYLTYPQNTKIKIPQILIPMLMLSTIAWEWKLSFFINIIICVILLTVTDYESWMLKSFYYLLFFLYIASSLVLILIMPEKTVFFDGSWSGIFSNPNGVTIPSLTLLLWMLWLYDNNQLRFSSVCWHGGLILLLIFQSESRSALLCAIVLLVSYHLWKKKVHWQWYLWAFFIFLGASIFMMTMFGRFIQNELHEFLITRLDIWNFCLFDMDWNLLLGNPNFFNFDYREATFPREYLFVNNAYSVPIEILVRGGVLRLFAFIWYVFCLVRLSKAKKGGFLYLIIFLLPILVESLLRPPVLDMNNLLYMISIYIIIKTPSKASNQPGNSDAVLDSTQKTITE